MMLAPIAGYIVVLIHSISFLRMDDSKTSVKLRQ